MSYLQGFLLQILIYAALWLYDDYVGLLICIIMASITCGILLFSYVVEFIEKSKVPKSFFRWLLISMIAPLIVTLIFTFIFEGQFDWMQE